MTGWLAVRVCQYLSDRRRRVEAEQVEAEQVEAEQVEAEQWARLAAALSELAAGLDRARAAEQERIGRHR